MLLSEIDSSLWPYNPEHALFANRLEGSERRNGTHLSTPPNSTNSRYLAVYHHKVTQLQDTRCSVKFVYQINNK